jgi:hypothetical protein
MVRSAGGFAAQTGPGVLCPLDGHHPLPLFSLFEKDRGFGRWAPKRVWAAAQSRSEHLAGVIAQPFRTLSVNRHYRACLLANIGNTHVGRAQ